MLKVWLPLNGNLDNQGLCPITITAGTPVWLDNGKLGQGLSLNSRVGFNCSALSGCKKFTVAFWVRIDDNPEITTNWLDVFRFNDQKADNSSTGQLRAETSYGNSSYYGVHWHDNATNAIASSLPTHYSGNRGIWKHCVLTVDSDVELKAYTDGVLVSTKSTSNGGHITGTFYTGESGVIGCMNDIRIYDHVLSPKEISELAKGLVRHYTLSPVTPTQLFDEDFDYQGDQPIITGNPLQLKIDSQLDINNVIIDVEPKQSGSGDPSPDNIRPITGISSFWLEHRGKNLWHNDDFIKGSVKKTDDGWYYATSIQWRNAFGVNANQNGLFGRPESLHWPRITISWDYYTPESVTANGNRLSVYIAYENGVSSTYSHCTSQASLGQVVHKTLTSKANAIVSRVYFSYGSSTTVYIKNFQIEFGTSATEFEDGVKSIYTEDFSSSAETVYGGNLNLTSGQLTVTHARKTATSITQFSNYAMISLGAKGIIDPNKIQLCNFLTYFSGTASAIGDGQFKCLNSDGYNRAHAIFKISGLTTTAEYNTYLAEMNDAGTPIEIIYGLTTPVVYQLTPQQMRTIVGLNNIYTNGSIITIDDPRENMYGLNDNVEYDVSGYRSDGEEHGSITYSSDTSRYVTSSVFDGTSYISANSLTNEVKTISLWVKTDWLTVSSGYKLLMHDTAAKLCIGFYSNNRFCTYIGSSSSDKGTAITYASLYNVNEWNHIVVVITGAKTRDVYINGQKAPTTTTTYFAGSGNQLLIGCRNYNGYKDYFDGQISDFRAYATELSEDDILALYHTPISLANDGTLLTQGEYVEV